MLIKRRRGWELPERLATPEAAVLGRRGIAAAAQWNIFGGSTKKIPPIELNSLAAKHNDKYVGGRPITPEQDATHYNNFYEFSEDKQLADAAQALPTSPWSITIGGMVNKPRTIAFEDLMKQVSLEER